jgi:hypothetical protein
VEFSEIQKSGFRYFGGPDDKESGHSGVKILKSWVVTRLGVNFGI